MFSDYMVNFRKSEGCPTSHELLDFQNGDLLRYRTSEIGAHIGICEFCSAEVSFYSHYPQFNEDFVSVEPVVIPAPLFELAEALLKNQHESSKTLNRMLRENEELNSLPN